MSSADRAFINTCRDILEKGTLVTDEKVRPKWDDGTPIKADHFGALTTNADFQYVIGVSGYDKEYYEQRIPWSALQGGAAFTAEAGVKIGYAFTCCPEEIDISEDADGSNDKYICFGAGITGYKNFGEYVGMTLVD